MKLSDYVASFLAGRGIEFMYIFTGGAIAHLVDSVYRVHEKDGTLTPVCVMHEQAGSMALDGYTRATGKIAAMAATSGPGATNLVTGIACSWYDSIPGIYFTGQVRTWECKGPSPQRQVGFQETNIVEIVRDITKYAVMITKPEEIRYELEKALWFAESGRPGPVLIDLPMDVQWAEIDPGALRGFEPESEESVDISEEELEKVVTETVAILKTSKRPVILSGGGVRNSGAMKEIKELAELFNIPVTVSFGGKDSFPHDSGLFCGLVGAMGNKETNKIINESDCFLVLGSRLSWRQIKGKPEDFVPDGKIVHIDIDKAELNQRKKADVAAAIDVKTFVHKLTDRLKREKLNKFDAWAMESKKRYDQNPFCKPEYYKEKGSVHPYVFFKVLSEVMGSGDVLVADAGQNVMWAMQAAEIRKNQRLFTSFAHSPMGYSLPAAMGVALKYNDNPRVICTIGDGGFQLNIQELQTIYANKIPVKVFIMNNKSYGAIMDYQDSALDGRYYASSCEYGYSLPDFAAIVKAYRIKVATIDDQDRLKDSIRGVIMTPGPIVCLVNLASRTYVTLDV